MATLHAEVLLAGRVYHMDDAADGYYPGHIAVARAFAHGELPTWEPGSWCGWPLVVDPYNGVFYPLNVVYYVLGAARGLGWAVAVHLCIAATGMLLLLRRRKLSWGAALFGAISFALSTFFVVRIRHVIFVQMAAWLPWVLAGVEGWMTTRRPRELVLTAAATGLALVAGALSIGHFAALVLVAYTAARVLSDRRPARAILSDLGALGGAALVGVLLAAAQLVPTAWHLPLSPRALGSDYAFASSYAWPSLKYLVTLVAPDWFGGENRARYVGLPNHWELAGWYVGAVAVALAPAGLMRPHKNQESRRGAELFALGALVVVAIAVALGDAGPVHPFFFKHLPLYAALRCPSRALLMAVAALPILGAHGVDNLLARRARVPRPALAWGLAVAVILVGIGVAIFVRPHKNMDLATELRHLASARLALALTAGAAALVVGMLGGVPARVAPLLVAAALAADLVATGRAATQPQPSDYPAGMERFAAVEWLRVHDTTGDRFVNDPRGPFRLHNVGMVLGMENASGYDSVAIWRYVELLYMLRDGHRYPGKKLRDDFAGIGVWGLQSPVLDVMNVRWLLAEAAPPTGPGPAAPKWIERFRPTSPTGAPGERHDPYWDARLRAYENQRALPRAFVAYAAVVPPGDDALASKLLARDFDPGHVALLEKQIAPSLPASTARPPTPATNFVHLRKKVSMDVDAAAPGVLVLGDAWYPGWRATVDGKDVEVLRVDWAFRGVVVGPGHHHVVFTYASRPTQVGIALSLLGLALLAGFVVVVRRRGSPGAVL